MERREFTIEPYVEASGIMGGEIEVDMQAADSIMKRTALRRDFKVTKGYFREAREAEGDEVLAISTAKVHNQRQVHEVGRSGISTLVRDGDTWFLQIHDQEISDQVNEWGRKHFKSGRGKTQTGVEHEEFIKRMRKEVGTGISNAFWNEKGSILISSAVKSSRLAVPFALAGYSIYTESNYFISESPFFGEYDRLKSYIVAGKIASVVIALSGWLVLEVALDSFVDDQILTTREKFIPNLQAPSIFFGSASLLLNSRKLIRLKQRDK